MSLIPKSVLTYTVWNNSGQDYLIALAVLVGLLIVLKGFKLYVIHALKRLAKKTKGYGDDLIIQGVEDISWPFYVYISLYVASRFLKLPDLANHILSLLLIVLVVYYAGKFLQRVIDHFIEREAQKREAQDVSVIKVLGKMVKAIIWIIAFLLVLSNLGVKVTSLLAGVGIGGVAIAFALQNVLADLFSSFSIYFDKPFQVGDFIIIGQDMGTVKHIGLKSTRIQTLQGQELIVSNRELTSTRVNNYKRMEKRRIVFTFGVEYSTPVKKLKMINTIVERVIGKVKQAELDRVHFKEFGDFSLVYEVVYYVDTKDYHTYMDVQQQINLGITEEFEKKGIVMAFPTQTIHLKRGG